VTTSTEDALVLTVAERAELLDILEREIADLRVVEPDGTALRDEEVLLRFLLAKVRRLRPTT
jgi:hypothetical protein